MHAQGLIGAIGGGLIGAAIWAAVSYFTHFEIGYIAWGIGALVGFCASALGGRGQIMATAAAAIALGSIVLGKCLAVYFVVRENHAEGLFDASSILNMVMDDLGAIDIIFALLGVATAFKVVMLRKEPQTAAAGGEKSV